MSPSSLSSGKRLIVLAAAFAALVGNGVELGLLPVASLSVSRSLLGEAYTAVLGGDWFARYTASIMLGAAVGGVLLGGLGDRIGRTRAMGASVLVYSSFTGLGALARTQEEMLVLRFLVGIGVGGVWPNAVALVAECWPDATRPTVAGVLGAAINCGILLLSQVARVRPITEDAWRWIFWLASTPAALGLLVLALVPESPRWLAARAPRAAPVAPLRELLRPPLRRITVVGVLLGTVPLLGAWAASKWMVPWADGIGGAARAGYKAETQGWWALGATIGSFSGAHVASLLGRRRSYFLISLGSTILTAAMFLLTAPLAPSFLPIVFAQGLVSTLFFGWLPLYLPELFPTRLRATGAGICFNVGRFATAAGVLASGLLFTAFGGDYAAIGAVGALVYALGMIVIAWAPDTRGRELE